MVKIRNPSGVPKPGIGRREKCGKSITDAGMWYRYHVRDVYVIIRPQVQLPNIIKGRSKWCNEVSVAGQVKESTGMLF